MLNVLSRVLIAICYKMIKNCCYKMVMISHMYTGFMEELAFAHRNG